MEQEGEGMKSKLIRLVTLAIVMVMVISLSLIGCKAATTETVAETAAVAETTAAVAETTAAVAETTAAATQPYAGTTLKVGSTASLAVFVKWQELFDPLYEKYSGVDVVTDMPPFTDFYNKVLTMVRGGGDDYDVMWLDGPWYGAFTALNALEPLNDYIKNQSDPKELALEDFPIRSFAYLGMDGVHKDQFYAIPLLHNVGILAYRKDLFENPEYMAEFKTKYGRELAPPLDWVEYLETCQFFTRDTNGDGEIDLWGGAQRYGEANNFIGDLLIGYAYARGATLFDKDYKPVMSSPEMIDAVKFFTAKEYLAAEPPGVESYNFDDVIGAISQGKTAMLITENMSVATIIDPTLSPQAANIAFTTVPGWKDPQGTIHAGTLAGAGGWAINANSKNKAAAFDYIQFMVGKSNSAAYIEAGKSAIRTSQYTDPELLKKYPWFAINLGQVKASIGRPQNAWWEEAQFIMGKAGVEVITAGKSVEQSMKDADAALLELLTTYKVYENKDVYYSPEEREQQALDTLKSLGINYTN